jgi:hypothetical protein
MTARRRALLVIPLLVLLGASAGCAGAAEDDAAAAATRFYQAYQSHDGDTACEQLAPKTRSELEQSAKMPCSKAVLEEDVPSVGRARDVHVFGMQTQVRYDGETTFLARFNDGWKVMAAACTAEPGQPYDCQISGG